MNPITSFPADSGYIRKAFSRLGGVNADHPERCIPVLVPSKPVPETHQKDSQQLV
jgi:hypothetical protein